jgi:UDP-N-acetylmuramate dehydrogenase
MNTYDILTSNLDKDRIIQNKNLSPFFTLRTPVTAEFYYEPQSRADWQAIISLAHEHDIPVFILGGGSNYAALTETIAGLTLRNQYRAVEVRKEESDSVDLFVSSGYLMSQLVRYTTERGYAGFEYHLGLPGTVGGAVVMNSKWTRPDAYVGDPLISATVLTREGKMKDVDKTYFQFSYGWSHLQQTNEILLDAVFHLFKEQPDILVKRSKEALAYRKDTQPHGIPTSGCFFKNVSEEEQQRLNLPTRSAGYLIDQTGLKGKSVGGFAVSEKHANFIINTGDGSLDDLKQLIGVMKEKVREKYDVQLREEVIIV